MATAVLAATPANKAAEAVGSGSIQRARWHVDGTVTIYDGGESSVEDVHEFIAGWGSRVRAWLACCPARM